MCFNFINFIHSLVSIWYFDWIKLLIWGHSNVGMANNSGFGSIFYFHDHFYSMMYFLLNVVRLSVKVFSRFFSFYLQLQPLICSSICRLYFWFLAFFFMSCLPVYKVSLYIIYFNSTLLLCALLHSLSFTDLNLSSTLSIFNHFLVSVPAIFIMLPHFLYHPRIRNKITYRNKIYNIYGTIILIFVHI